MPSNLMVILIELYFLQRMQLIFDHIVLLFPVKLFETILFPQDMIQDIYKLHWNIIHKSTGSTSN